MDTVSKGTHIAGADMPGGSRVTLNSNGTISLAGNTTIAIGTLEVNGAKNGQEATVFYFGPIRRAIAGGTLSIGDALIPGANGQYSQAAGPTTGLMCTLDAAAIGESIRIVPREK